MGFEIADVRGDGAVVLAAVPVDRDKGDGTARALLEKRRKPVEAHGVSGAVRSGAVGHAGGAEQDGVAGVRFHVLVERCDGGTDVHVRLAHIVRFVE